MIGIRKNHLRSIDMIKKTSKGFQVVSKKGKPLSKDNLTKEQAKQRLKEVETFKHKKGGK